MKRIKCDFSKDLSNKSIKKLEKKFKKVTSKEIVTDFKGYGKIVRMCGYKKWYRR